MSANRIFCRPKITKHILQNLKHLEFDLIRPKLSTFLTQYDHWKLPKQTEEFYISNISKYLKNNDPTCEYSLNSAFKLEDYELNIAAKLNSSLFAYLAFPHLADQDLRYCGVLKLFTEWLFIFDDFVESTDQTELVPFLQCLFTELFSSSDQPPFVSVQMSEKAVQFGKQLKYVVNKLETLTSTDCKEQFLNINKDYIISLLLEKCLLTEFFDHGTKIQKHEHRSIRSFAACVYPYSFAVQLLAEDYKFTPYSMFEQVGIYTITDALNYYHQTRRDVSPFGELYDQVTTRGYQIDANDTMAEYEAVHSIAYYNDLVGFRKEVKEEAYPFNSVYVYGSSLTDQQQILNGCEIMMDEFDKMNVLLDKRTNNYAKNLKICCYGINLWQDLAYRYKEY